MAIAIPITAPRGAEDVYQSTPVSAAFSRLLDDLARYVEAERDIEDVDVWHTAFRDRLTQAENAQTRVASRLTEIKRSVITGAEDKPLQRMALLIDGIMGGEDRAAVHHYLQLHARFVHLFRTPGANATAQRVDRMLRTARGRITELVALDIHGGGNHTTGNAVHQDGHSRLVSLPA